METPKKTTLATGAAAATVPVNPHSNGRLSRAERDELLNTAAAGMTPERLRDTQDPLKIWAPQIRRKYRQGYSVRQIVDMLKSPAIDIKVSVRAVQRVARRAVEKQKASA